MCELLLLLHLQRQTHTEVSQCLCLCFRPCGTFAPKAGYQPGGAMSHCLSEGQIHLFSVGAGAYNSTDCSTERELTLSILSDLFSFINLFCKEVG